MKWLGYVFAVLALSGWLGIRERDKTQLERRAADYTDRLEKERTRLERANQGNVTRRRELQQRYEEEKLELAALEQRVSELTAKQTELKARVKNLSTQIDTLEDDRDEHAERKDKSLGRIGEAQQKLAVIERQIALLRKHMADVTDKSE